MIRLDTRSLTTIDAFYQHIGKIANHFSDVEQPNKV